MEQTMSRTVSLAFALAACIAGQAAAETAPAPQSATVAYGDLDVSHAAGANALLPRIRTAAIAVCQPPADVHDMRGVAEAKACVQAAMTRAVADVGRPSVTAAYRQAPSKLDLATR